MRGLAKRSIVIVLGTCLAAAGVVGQAADPAPVEAKPVEATPDEASAWAKVWHPAFRPTLGSRTDMQGAQWLDGRFAVVGGDERGAAVWWSEDGVEWRRTRRSASTDRGLASSIAAGPGGYVMVGIQRTPKPRARIWHSADGLEWEPAESKLPPGSGVLSVASTEEGTFVAYGDLGRVRRHNGCWMGTSADGGVTWDLRWEGDWDPGSVDDCVVSVAHDGNSFVGRIDGGISESTDGVSWQGLATWKEIRGTVPQGKGRRHDVGLVPLDDGRFAIGGRGMTTITWSRDDGLALDEDLVDWTDLDRVQLALGPDRAVAVKSGKPAPAVSPPADRYTEPWARREPRCRSRNPQIRHIAAMTERERLECYGGRELTFEAWIPYSEYGGTCPFGAPYAWIRCWNYWLASDLGPSPGFLNFGWAPGARDRRGVNEGSGGAHVRVTGHFDDPAAARCPEPGWDGRPLAGWSIRTKAQFVDDCRKQFIVTRMRRIKD